MLEEITSPVLLNIFHRNLRDHSRLADLEADVMGNIDNGQVTRFAFHQKLKG